jgi:hypothetical protein
MCSGKIVEEAARLFSEVCKRLETAFTGCRDWVNRSSPAESRKSKIGVNFFRHLRLEPRLPSQRSRKGDHGRVIGA